MSIETMIKMSHLLLTVSGLLAVTSVIIFFTLDISKCWKMVSGKAFAAKRRPGVNRLCKKNKKLEEISDLALAKRNDAALKTVLLHDGTGTEYRSTEETLLLNSTEVEKTTLLATEDLELIQDIVYMQGEE